MKDLFRRETKKTPRDPGFFDQFDRFLKTSETGTVKTQGMERLAARLNARYGALVAANRDSIAGANVLDLASHDGRWSFAALRNGAKHVVGIERVQRLIQKSKRTFAHYEVTPDLYTFILGDVFTEIENVERTIDVVFCFGLFYHINNHILLLSKIEELKATTLIIDTNISLLKQPVIHLKHEGKQNNMVGHPSRNGLVMMLENFGWKTRFFDWRKSGLIDGPNYQKRYDSGSRVTVVCSK